MNAAEPTELLLRDKAELDKIAFAFREGRTVTAFIVCPPSLRAGALQHLRTTGRTWVIPDPLEPVDAAQMHAWLKEATTKLPREIVSVVIPRAGGPVLNALNLHREKLRDGASKLLFIDSAEGLAALRAQGRDAYAFRDIVGYLQGETPVPTMALGEEPAELIEARERHARATLEQAEDTIRFASRLRARGDYAQAEQVLRSSLALFDDAYLRDEEFACMYAYLSFNLAALFAARGNRTDAAHSIERGLAFLEAPVTASGKLSRLVLLAAVPGPYGGQLDSLRLALATADEFQMHEIVKLFQGLTLRHTRCGNARVASRYLMQIEATPDTSPFNRAQNRRQRAVFANSVGRFETAELVAREASEMFTDVDADPQFAHETLAESFFLRGEMDAARRMLTPILQSNSDRVRMADARLVLARLAIATGNVAEGLEAFRTLARDAFAVGADRTHYNAHANLVENLVDLHAAGRLSTDELTHAMTELDNAEGLSEAAFGTDPPWYTILFPLRRSELAALRSTADALVLSQTALDRARTTYPELVPEAARVHGQHLIRAGQFDDALTTLALAEATAREEELLREVANAIRWGIVAAVRANKPAADIEARIIAFRETLLSSDSPRLTAEQLLELATSLPTASTLPDPLLLADEALDLFAAMPYPAKQARSIEVAGDIIAARGDTDGAIRRYRAALAVLERFQLRLRIPILEAKISA